VLDRAGLTATPALADAGPGAWITLRVAPGAEPAPTPSKGLLMPSLPPRLAAATGLLIPVFLIVAVALADGPRPSSSNASPGARSIATADDALRAGDFRRAVRARRAARPGADRPVRGTIVSTLTAQAMAAQREGAYVRAIRLSRRAARFGSAPGTSRIIRQSRGGLDLRRRGLSARR
jgi:hypothetical protein